jgi:hypothetical protein
LGCKDPFHFPFITPPPRQHLLAALLSLSVLGATSSPLVKVLPFLFDVGVKSYEVDLFRDYLASSHSHGGGGGGSLNENELVKFRLSRLGVHPSTIDSLFNIDHCNQYNGYGASTMTDDINDDDNVNNDDGKDKKKNSGEVSSYDVLNALRVDVGVASLTDLGELMADLPIDPPIR